MDPPPSANPADYSRGLRTLRDVVLSRDRARPRIPPDGMVHPITSLKWLVSELTTALKLQVSEVFRHPTVSHNDVASHTGPANP
jgi:hypothetical protein